MKINIEMSKKEKRVAKWLLAITVLAYITAVFGPTFTQIIKKPAYPPLSLGHEYIQSQQVPEKCLSDRFPNRLGLKGYFLSKLRGHDYLVYNAAPWFFRPLDEEGHYNIDYIEDHPECIGHLLNGESLRNTRKTKKFIYNFYDTSSEKLVYQIIKHPES